MRSNTEALKEYTRYVRQRVFWMDKPFVECSDNQMSFYNEMLKDIKSYATNHLAYCNFIFCKISFKRLMTLIGKTEHGTFRFLSNQNQQFIRFLRNREVYNFAKYPFDDNLKYCGLRGEEYES